MIYELLSNLGFRLFRLKIPVENLDQKDCDGRIKEIMKAVHDILTDISRNPRGLEHDKKQMKILARLDKIERKTYENKYRSGRNPMDHVMRNTQNKFTDVDIIAMESHEVIEEYIGNIVNAVWEDFKVEGKELTENNQKYIEKKLEAVIKRFYENTMDKYIMKTQQKYPDVEKVAKESKEVKKNTSAILLNDWIQEEKQLNQKD